MSSGPSHDAVMAAIAAAANKQQQATSSTTTDTTDVVVPPPPSMPSYLAPNPANFNGYKLSASSLGCTNIPLTHTVNTDTAPLATTATGTAAAPAASFLTLANKLKTNQLVVLRGEGASGRAGAHALFYVDHVGVWQVDPPASQSGSSDAEATDASHAEGGSHSVYAFDSPEEGEGLGLTAVAPCFLLLTRAGGRLTVLLADTTATARTSGEPLKVLFDGSPLSPAPLSPHDATVSAASLTRERDRLLIVLYEFWEEHAPHDAPKSSASESTMQFVHEGDALRTAGNGVSTEAPATAAFSAIGSSPKHALHKLTMVQFEIRNLVGFGTAPPVRNQMAGVTGEACLDLVHSFSSVQNGRLARGTMPPQFANDANWSAPLACWIEIPAPNTHVPATPATPAASSPPPFLFYVIARVPYLNETESVIHELQRLATEKEDESRGVMEPAEIPRVKSLAGDDEESKTSESPSAAASSSSTAATPNPIFTSDNIVSDTHNLKHYAIDHEDDDEDMDEMGTNDPSSFSLNPHVDPSVQLFDPLGSLIARRSFKQHAFLFAQVNEGAHLARRHTVIGLKQGEEMLLYTAHSASQPTAAGLSLGAAGCVQPLAAGAARLGIVLKPIFSYAGLGYVQSGKQFKKFFMEDGAHQFVVIGEYTKHVYVYGRPSNNSNTAPHFLLQMPHEEDANVDDTRQIFGLQTVIVPVPTGPKSDANTTDSESAATPAVQGQPLLYVLTRRACRQYRLPIVTLTA